MARECWELSVGYKVGIQSHGVKGLRQLEDKETDRDVQGILGRMEH